MPFQPPHYSVPSFPPTGNAETDAALTQWASDFGQQHQETQEAASRTPFIVTTVNTSVGGSGENYLSKSVSMLGGEQVVVTAYLDCQVSAGGTLTTNGLTNAQSISGKLRVQYPGGTVTTFGSNQEVSARIQVSGMASSGGSSAPVNVKTTVLFRGNMAYEWPIEARFQSGGEHTFIVRTTGGGSVQTGRITIMVL